MENYFILSSHHKTEIIEMEIYLSLCSHILTILMSTPPSPPPQIHAQKNVLLTNLALPLFKLLLHIYYLVIRSVISVQSQIKHCDSRNAFSTKQRNIRESCFHKRWTKCNVIYFSIQLANLYGRSDVVVKRLIIVIIILLHKNIWELYCQFLQHCNIEGCQN